MGLFTDSMPIKSLVSLSARGGSSSNSNTSNSSMGNNIISSNTNSSCSSNNSSKCNASSTNTTNNNGQQQPSLSVSFCMSGSAAPIIQQLQKHHQQQQQNQNHKKHSKAGTMSAVSAISTTTTTLSTSCSITTKTTATDKNHHKCLSTASTNIVSLSKICEGGGNHVREGNGSASMQQLSTSWEFIKLGERPIHDFNSCSDDKDEPQDLTPPRYIKISDGKISLGPPTTIIRPPPLQLNQQQQQQLPPQQQTLSSISSSIIQATPYECNKDQEVLEARIVELEEALCRLQEKVNNSQCNSPTLERDLKEQLENMNRAMKSKERKAIQAYRDHKALQARFTRQENLLHMMQQENKSLHQRIRQYEHCLDDVMRKVVDAIVAEDSLREEVAMLKSRVRDLEAQNAALCAKGRDEGYCTMSTGQPQPSNSHLEDLPEEPEQWLMSGSGCGGVGNNLGIGGGIVGIGDPTSCSAGDMEDWSMSQEELGIITLDDDPNDREIDWIWNSNSYLNSTMIDSQSEGISQLLQETIVYSEDEEIACIDFTRDFYKLVNIPSGSTKSLYSHVDADTDDEDEDDDDEDKTSSDSDSNCPRNNRYHAHHRDKDETSPTPSEAGQAQVASCSSTTSSDASTAENQSNQSRITSLIEYIEKTKSIDRTSSKTGTNNTRQETKTKQPISAAGATTTTSIPIAISTINSIHHETLVENSSGENFGNNCSSSSTNSSSTLATTSATTSYSSSSSANAADKCSSWRRSNGWKRLGPQNKKQNNYSEPFKSQRQYYPLKSTKSTASTATTAQSTTTTVATTQSKIPPPVPVRRSYAS